MSRQNTIHIDIHEIGKEPGIFLSVATTVPKELFYKVSGVL